MGVLKKGEEAETFDMLCPVPLYFYTSMITGSAVAHALLHRSSSNILLLQVAGVFKYQRQVAF